MFRNTVIFIDDDAQKGARQRKLALCDVIQKVRFIRKPSIFRFIPPNSNFATIRESCARNSFSDENEQTQVLFLLVCQDGTINFHNMTMGTPKPRSPEDSDNVFHFSLATLFEVIRRKNHKMGLFWPFFYFYWHISTNNVANHL